MKTKILSGVLVVLLGLLMIPAEAPAIQEEVVLKIYNQQPYDLLLETGKAASCELEEPFNDPPGDIPFHSFKRISWSGQCDIRLVWSIRYFTGLTVTVRFQAETGELIADSGSNEFLPTLMGPRCEEGVCEYRLVIWNAEPFWN